MGSMTPDDMKYIQIFAKNSVFFRDNRYLAQKRLKGTVIYPDNCKLLNRIGIITSCPLNHIVKITPIRYHSEYPLELK